MCTYTTETLEITGSGKGRDGWFPLTTATVHPVLRSALDRLRIGMGHRWSHT